MSIVLYRHFESKAFSRSPRLPNTECRIGRLENLKLVSNGNTSNMIPILNVYGNINLVCTWSNLPENPSDFMGFQHVANQIYISIENQKCISFL